MISLLIFLYK